MLCGQINKQNALTEIFRSHKEIKEVYSSVSFHIVDEHANFYLLVDRTFNYSILLQQLSCVYGIGNVNVYVSKDPLSIMFSGNRIVWKEGVWFQ